MCISDWRLGRMMVHNVQPFNITAGTGLILPESRQRVGLIIAATVVLTATQGFLASCDGTGAIAVTGLSGGLFLNLAHNGSIVQARWTISDLFGGTTGAFTEVLLPEAYLSAGLDEFMSKHGLK